MSAVIKTATPFLIDKVLMTALDRLGAEPTLVTQNMLNGIQQRNRVLEGDILTNREDYNGRQFFRKNGDNWILLHDRDEYNGKLLTQLADKRYQPVSRFLTDLGKYYEAAYEEHIEMIAEQERVRLEEERKARVEMTRKLAVSKAKEQGYSVKETRNSAGQIQLVLTRTV